MVGLDRMTVVARLEPHGQIGAIYDTLMQGGSPQCTVPLEIHHRSYTEGMLGLPRPEITLMGEKILVRVIKAVLGPHQDVGELADADLVIDRGSDPYEALPEARSKPLGVAIIFYPQHRLQDVRYFVPYPTRDATPVGIFAPPIQ